MIIYRESTFSWRAMLFPKHTQCCLTAVRVEQIKFWPMIEDVQPIAKEIAEEEKPQGRNLIQKKEDMQMQRNSKVMYKLKARTSVCIVSFVYL